MLEEKHTPEQAPSEGIKPKVEVAFGSDQLNRRYVLVTAGDQKALLSPADLMLPPSRLAQELALRGILVFNKDAVTDIVVAAEATAKATAGKPTFQVALVPGWHYRDVAKTADLYQAKIADLYLHGSTLIGNASGVFVDPGFLILGDRPRKFSSRGDRRAWRKLVKRFVAGQPLLTFLIAAAFASMILSRLGIQPFVVLLWGPSSIGKSSAAVLIGSIFGGDPSRPQHSFVESFKVTEAGIEKLGLSHKDILLLLDEFSRVRGPAAQKIVVLEGFTDDY